MSTVETKIAQLETLKNVLDHCNFLITDFSTNIDRECEIIEDDTVSEFRRECASRNVSCYVVKRDYLKSIVEALEKQI